MALGLWGPTALAQGGDGPERPSALLTREQPVETEQTLLATLRAEPQNLAAMENLVQLYLDQGDVEEAARMADRRRHAAPSDLDWLLRWASVVRDVEGRRQDVIDGYQKLIGHRPESLEAWLGLARVLSWSHDDLDQAVAAYRQAVELNPRSWSARIGLAQTLSWSGHFGEAVDRYDALLADRPSDPQALLGGAQLARWQGKVRKAHLLLSEAEASQPDNPRVIAERARLDLDRDRRRSAERARDRALLLAPELLEAQEAAAILDQARAPRAGVRWTWSAESTPFWRQQLAAQTELRPLADTRLRLKAAGARFEDSDATLDRGTLGFQVRQAGMPQGLQLTAGYSYHQPRETNPTHELSGELALRPLEGPLVLRAGMRRRAMVDLPSGYEDIAYLDGLGSGGTTVASIADGLQISEGYLNLSLTPLAGLYVYADGVTGRIDDGNTRSALATGLGKNLLMRATWTDLVVKYDYYGLTYGQTDTSYFSPDSFQVHTPGLDWRVRPGQWLTVGAEAGLPVEIGGKLGYRLGGFFRLAATDRLMFEGRVLLLDNTLYRLTAATLGGQVVF